MRKIILIIILVVLAAILFIPVFQPGKNEGLITADHIIKQENVPDTIKSILANSCFDCHSNNTNYQWYHHVTPVAWMINTHILDGKEELNFSDWKKMDVYDQVEALEEICKEVKAHKMPIKPYLKMHPGAKLTDDQIAQLCDWTDKLSEEIISSVSQ